MQQVNLGIAIGVYTILWATGQKAEAVPVVIYTLILGNFLFALDGGAEVFLARLSPALSFVCRLAIMYAATPLVVVLASGVVFALHPHPPPFISFLRAGWKFPTVVAWIAGTVNTLYSYVMARLEHRNIELEQAVKTERAERDQAQTELERAREVQQNLLPSTLPSASGFQIASHFEPARVVGGDYFDVIKLSETKLGICIADVAGKSISAALLMANVQASVRAFASESASPASVCSRMNTVLCNNIARGKFVTFFYGVLDSAQRRFQYCSAGHVPPILTHADGTSGHLQCEGAVLGVFPDWEYRDVVLEFTSGDRLLLFTDGASEACSAEGEEYGEERMAALAARSVSMSGQQLLRTLIHELKNFCSSQLHDDLTLIVIAAD